MQTREAIEKMILEKAMKDEAFRKDLMQNPKETVEKEMGVAIPQFIHIEILEEKADTFYLILPPVSNVTETDELTERELNGVAAGGNWIDDVVNFLTTDSFCCY